MFIVTPKEKIVYVSRTIRFPAEMFGQLQALAKEVGMSFNKLVICCCEFALENLEQDGPA